MGNSVVESLILDLLKWLVKRDRSCEKVMDEWRTSCARRRFGRMRMIADLS
jgi:hypothetical protein